MSRITIDRRDGGIVHVVLSRPERRNAIDWGMLTALARAARQLKRDRGLRAVILRGDGPSFCSGLDFPRMTDWDPADPAASLSLVRVNRSSGITRLGNQLLGRMKTAINIQGSARP